MATRMQQRRGTAAQWTSSNPVLNAGEMGWESDTNKFKMGDGTNHWADLDYFIDANSTANPSFGSSITFEGTTANDFETTLAITDPTADRTITFPNATGTVVLSDGSGNVTVSGNLTVNGATTSLVSNELVITDKNIVLAATEFPTNITASGGGITVKGTTDKTFSYNDSSDTWSSSESLNLPTGKSYKINGVNLGTVSETLSNKTISSSDNTISIAPSNISGVTVNTTEINYLTGVSSAIQTQFTNKAPLASPSFTGNVVLPSTTSIGDVSSIEIGYVNGVTSAIQTQLDNKQNIDANVSSVEIGYLNGVTSDIQTQLNDKAPLASPTFTGTVTLPSGTVTSTMILDGTIANVDINASAAIDWTKLGISSTVSSTEIGYVDGVTSAIQTQIDTKAPLASPTFTGTVNAAALTLSGDLIVNGTTTTINSTTLSVDDKNIELGSVASPSDVTADGGGITLKGATDKTFNWVDATDSWTSSEHINLASGKDLKVNGTAVISSTAGGFIFTDGTQTLEGVPSRTPIIQKTASYTLSSLTERDDLIEMSSASALVLTIPTDATLDYPIGTSIDILQTGAGQVTIAPVSGTVTVNATPGLKLRTTWSSATLFKRAANTWVVFGDLTA